MSNHAMPPLFARRRWPLCTVIICAALFASACADGSSESDDVASVDGGPGAGPATDARPMPADARPGTSDARPGPTADARPGNGSLSATQQALFDALNEQRQAAGQPPLQLRDDLVCAAQAHSDDIGARGECDIVGENGETFADRVVACAGPSVATATVGCRYLSGTAAADAWAQDDGSSSLFLDPSIQFVGVGEHNRYWTAIFD